LKEMVDAHVADFTKKKKVKEKEIKLN